MQGVFDTNSLAAAHDITPCIRAPADQSYKSDYETRYNDNKVVASKEYTAFAC